MLLMKRPLLRNPIADRIAHLWPCVKYIIANASPLNGPIGTASRRKDGRKGGSEELERFGAGYTRKAGDAT